MNGKAEYEQALQILGGINDTNVEREAYGQALDLLAKAYGLGHRQEEIYAFFYQRLYIPNEVKLRRTYAINCRKLGKAYSFVKGYDKLPFLVFPLSKKKYWVFYKETQAFRPGTWMVYCDYLIEQLLVDDAPDVAWLQAEFEEWENHEMAYLLYREIEHDLSGRKLNGNLPVKLNLYQMLSGNSDRSDALYARYYFAQNDMDAAEWYISSGLRKRRLNFELHILMGDIALKRNDYIAAIHHYLLMSKVGRSQKPVDLRPRIRLCVKNALERGGAYLDEFINACELSMAKPNLYPFVPKISFDDAYDVQMGTSKFCGDWLDFGTGKSFYRGIHNERYGFSLFELNKEALLNYLADDKNIGSAFQFYTYRLIPGKPVNEYEHREEDAILQLAATDRRQTIEFERDGKKDCIKLGQKEINYFKLHENTVIRSDAPFIVGEKLRVGHSKKRKRLVLSILVDALSFAYIKEHQYRPIPNIMKFFRKGVIFNENYTPAEWTYPSFAAIQTGMRIDQTQIFHAQARCPLDPKYKTIAEYMQEQGYICLNTMDGIDSVFNGVCRGFIDSYAGYINRAYDSVERTIQYMRAFRDSDCYINLHFDDVHVVYGKEYQINIPAQTALYAEDRCNMNNEKSVRAKANQVNTTNYRLALSDVDRILGNLFRYIQEHYEEEDYIVALYSDHGVPIFANHTFTLSQSVSSTAFMIRWGGDKTYGLVKNEVTSTVDLLAIFSKILDFPYDDQFTDTTLPKVFGGKGREYAISQGIYPGQVYRMAINTLGHEFFIQSLDHVTYDGRINGNRFIFELYNKDDAHTKCMDRNLLQKFLHIYRKNIRSIHDADFEKIYAKE